MPPKLAASSLAIYCVFALTSLAISQDRLPRIINGDPTDEFDAVGIIGSIDGGGFCTGTLISPYHVITAAHCVETIAPSDDATFEVGGQIYVASTILVHPDYDSQNLTNDLAILELVDPVFDVAPMELLRSSPSIGDVLTIVGFGAAGDAQGSDGSFGIKQVGTTSIDDLTSTEVIWRFDDEDEGNSAAGDSGGPALLEIDGVYYLAAIVSSGTDPFSALGDVAFNMRVDAYDDWIDVVVETLPPDDEPDPDEEPSGEDPSEEESEPTGPPEEDPGEPEPTVEDPSGCKFNFASFFNWRPAFSYKPSRGQAFRRPSRRPPSRFPQHVGPRHNSVTSTLRR